MTIKVAVTISGAVSLGTFEAGALFEVLRSLAHHNTHIGPDAEARVEIDVLTGSSAGGMSVAIAAQKLLYDSDSLSGPYDNALYKAWVERADLGKLLELSGDDPELSVLSSNCICSIADEFIPHASNAAAALPHSACAKELRVGLTLSNLNGIDYSVGIYGGDVSESLAANAKAEPGEKTEFLDRFRTGRFVYTRYQDEFVETFAQGAFQTNEWNGIRQAAVACGSFPFAFRTIELFRPRDYYLARGATGFPPTDDRYVFTDGGVFQNEPLGLAKNLVDQIDLQHVNGNDRYYLYIAPCARTSSRDEKPFKASDMNALHMGSALAKAVFNEARFQDWVYAERTNQAVLLLDARARELIELLRPKPGSTPPFSAEEILRVTSPLLDLLYRVRKKDRKWSDETETLASARRRLRVQYAQELASFESDERLAEAWLEVVLLLEHSAQLGRKDQMKVLGITAQESELAGAKLFSFQGFFDRKLRVHDYELGRLKSRQIIRTLGNVINHGLPAEDSDLQLETALDGFDVLKSKDRKYRSLFERLVCRTFDYVSHPVLHSISARKILSRWFGFLITLMPFQLALYLAASILLAVLTAAVIQLWNTVHIAFLLPVPLGRRKTRSQRGGSMQ